MIPVPRRLAGLGVLGVLVAVVLAFALAGCTSLDTLTAPPVQPVSSPVTGVPINIEAEGFSRVTAFTIRTDAGEEVRFAMGILENGAESPPNHLAAHLAGSTPVHVFFRREGGEDSVYRLEDAEPVP